MNILHKTLITLLLSLTTCAVFAYENVTFHCEQDTVIINSLLASGELKDMTPAERVGFFARKLVGTPSSLREEILEPDSTVFTVSVHGFTPLGFISACIALAQAYETSSAPGWRDFADRYEAVMYKGGKSGDFASKMLYGSDWITDNIFRGNVKDATPDIDGIAIRRKEKSIDYISHHKDHFKALSDESNLNRMKMLEMGFRNHQIPYLSNGDITSPSRYAAKAKEGDIFFLLTPDYNLDFREMGILVKDGDELKIIHVSYPREEVTVEPLPFPNYVKRNIKRIQGARIIRIY